MSPVDRRAAAGLHRTIPALPVRDVLAAVAYYRERFGFDSPHETSDFAVLVRDEAVLHLWGATDDEWRSRGNLQQRPICSGAESFLAGTASCRIEVSDVDALFAECKPRGCSTRSRATAWMPPTSARGSSPRSTATAISSRSFAGTPARGGGDHG